MGLIKFSQDPLYGNIELLFPEIDNYLRTYDLLRLQHIRQANLTSLVFPGATHTRYAHALGSMYIAQETFDYLSTLPENKDFFSEKEWRAFKNFVMLFLLLHDTAHPPFSHVIEHATKHYNPHEDPDCKDINDFIAFETIGAPLEWQNLSHENVLCHILSHEIDIEELKNYYRTWLTDWYPEVSIKEFLPQDNNPLNEELGFNEIGINDICESYVDLLNNRGNIVNRFPFLKDLTDSYIDLDRLDHLSRDAYGSGIRAAILNCYLTIHNFRINKINDKPVLSLTKEGIPPIVHLLTAREILYDVLYSHPHVRAYEAEFQRALIKLLAHTDLDIDNVLLSIDYFAFKNLLDACKDNTDKYAKNMLNRILSQQPHNLFAEFKYKKRSLGKIEPFNITINELEKVEEEIAHKLKIQKHDIIIYIEWTGNMGEIARSKFGDTLGISIFDDENNEKIEDYHPWIKDVLTDWSNRASCRVYLDNKVKKSSQIQRIIESSLQDCGLIAR